jgi:hypothetical protein
MKTLALAALFVSPLALAAGPGANCPAATTVAGDGGTIAQQYFQPVCNLNNPIAISADPVQAQLYFATQGSWDGGKYNDGTIYSVAIDGGAAKKLTASTQACPYSLASDGINVIWVNAGTSCSFTDAGSGGQNALLDTPWDGGAVAVLVGGDQGIKKVVSDGTSAYFTVENQSGNNPAIGAVESVLLDAGAGYPVTTLWTSASGTAMFNGQICSWTGGLLSCPAMGVVNQPIFNGASSIAVANGILYWGPGGMSMPTNASSIPTAYGFARAFPARTIVPFDGGVVWQSGSGIIDGRGRSLATNSDPYYGALATDQTTFWFPCNTQTNGTMGVCQVPFADNVTHPVQVANEFVAAPGSSSTAFSYTASAPAITTASYVLSLAGANATYTIASDDGGGYFVPAGKSLPSGFPVLLDGGLSYTTGALGVSLSAPLPTGFNLVGGYTGTTTTKAIQNQVLIGTGFPGIAGMVVDSLGNLDWVSPTGLDAGSITTLQPK